MDKWLRRMVIGAAVAIAGSGYSLVFGGATFPECLGPLGVTGVQCVAHGGRLPTDPLWPSTVVVSCALGALLALPAKRSWIDGVGSSGASSRERSSLRRSAPRRSRGPTTTARGW